ncbi:hypothetical protein CGRA01v4_10321 [Colletotrichum graminicola]|nr:hypothetical protein CGRA01v4_10321 [Colletotrichum graminicola]
MTRQKLSLQLAPLIGSTELSIGAEVGFFFLRFPADFDMERPRRMVRCLKPCLEESPHLTSLQGTLRELNHNFSKLLSSFLVDFVGVFVFKSFHLRTCSYRLSSQKEFHYNH